MTQDFEKIGPIASLANTKTVGGEVAFTYPEVIEVIHLCTANEIAVLGVEVFLARDNEYFASGCSTYDLRMHKWDKVQMHDWGNCVRENNLLAEDAVRKNPTGDDHIYVLTTSSWREFCKIQEMRQQ